MVITIAVVAQAKFSDFATSLPTTEATAIADDFPATHGENACKIMLGILNLHSPTPVEINRRSCVDFIAKVKGTAGPITSLPHLANQIETCGRAANAVYRDRGGTANFYDQLADACAVILMHND